MSGEGDLFPPSNDIELRIESWGIKARNFYQKFKSNIPRNGKWNKNKKYAKPRADVKRLERFEDNQFGVIFYFRWYCENTGKSNEYLPRNERFIALQIIQLSEKFFNKREKIDCGILWIMLCKGRISFAFLGCQFCPRPTVVTKLGLKCDFKGNWWKSKTAVSQLPGYPKFVREHQTQI